MGEPTEKLTKRGAVPFWLLPDFHGKIFSSSLLSRYDASHFRGKRDGRLFSIGTTGMALPDQNSFPRSDPHDYPLIDSI